MPVRFYIVPTERFFTAEPGSGGALGVWEEHCKYFRSMAGLRPSRRPYGQEGVDLVGVDITAFDHNLVTANSDVLAFPENLDATPNTSARNQTITALESRGIPAGWIVAGMTWRQILRTVWKIVMLTKRMNGGANLIGRLLDNGRTLSTQFQDLPQPMRQRMVAYAGERGWDTSGLSNTSTIRQILKFLADQITETPNLCGVNI